MSPYSAVEKKRREHLYDPEVIRLKHLRRARHSSPKDLLEGYGLYHPKLQSILSISGRIREYL